MTQGIIIALVLAGTGALMHKCIRIHKMLFLLKEELSAVKLALHAKDPARDVASVYDQLQAYLDLTRLLAPVAPLPRLSCSLLVIDDPPAETAVLARYPALRLLSPRFASGRTIFLDDYGRDAERRIVQRWLAETPGLALESIETEKGCARLTCD